MGYVDRISAAVPKKLLALDGGGIRGVLSIEILARIEKMIRERSGDNSMKLGDYFDYIGGTSTGAILAAGLARGMHVDELRSIYHDHGKEMFRRSSLWRRIWYRYGSAALQDLMQEKFGADTPFGDSDLHCLLMVMLRNASTDSPWPLSNNPHAKYNDRARPDCNLDIPLWQLVRASTAAPVYFPPESIALNADSSGKTHNFVFVDGGVTMSNNPSFQLFLMATLDAYRLSWPTGKDNLLLVSVGTGTAPKANEHLRPCAMNFIYNALAIPGALMGGALNEQDLLCRVFGACRHGDKVDREVGQLLNGQGGLRGSQPLFAYVRYNASLTREGLTDLGFPEIDPAQIQKMDAVDNISDLQRIGTAAAAQVTPDHFQGFL
jgi:uncharacterized protein